MKKQNQSGFSLIELLIVVVVIGIIAAISVPSFNKAIGAAENGSTQSLMRSMLMVQSMHFTQKNRYGRLDEINTLQNGTFGTVVSNSIQRGKFKIEMVPANPTDAQLREGFTIVATRTADHTGVPYVVTIDQGGNLVATVVP